jgi:N-acetylglucosaminyldiphosphoundecaprenol N-acetyl-beta-D-mannosaminyltransferase
MEVRKLISLDISLISYSDALTEVVSLAKANRPSYFSFANVHMLIEAYWNAGFSGKVNGSTRVFADGMPLVKAIEFLFGDKTDRIAGMDMMPDIIRKAEENDLKLFFFGTTDDLLGRIRDRILKEHPGLREPVFFSPPFDQALNSESYVEMINSSGANIVFVALGCPKQENWMAVHSHKIKAALLGVGGAFPVYANVVRRAPKFMRDYGLEWLYRLFQEPGRLFMRYLKTNSLFIVLMLSRKLRNFFN